MYKNLYDSFEHWYHNGKGTVLFYSDPHFNDEEANLLRKNYIGDDAQVASINSRVGKYDTLVILGDIGDVEYVRKLRGYKVLVMGNHDKGISNYKRVVKNYIFSKEKYTYDEILSIVNVPKNWKIKVSSIDLSEELGAVWHVTVDNCLFDEVYEGAVLIAPNIMLSHEPVDFPFARNVHGHTHGKWDAFNMCAEFINYTPVPISYFIKYGFKDIKDIHRNAIENAQNRNIRKSENI